MVEAGADHPGVPATFRFELLIKLLHCVVSNLHGCHNLYCLHQNLPQYFRRNHVADSILIFELFRRNHVADVLDYFIKTTSPIHLFPMTIWAMETIQENFYYS